MEKQQQQQPQIDLTKTDIIQGKEGEILFNQGIILRKISKFLTDSGEDGIIPIPVFYEVKTGKILSSTIPKEIRDEYTDFVMGADE